MDIERLEELSECGRELYILNDENLIERIRSDNQLQNYLSDSVDAIDEAMQAYQPTISKTETTSCEWCGSDLQILAQAMAIDGAMKFATKQSNYCPNCGRHL